MRTDETNTDTDRIRQEKLDAKQKEIVEKLDNVSLKEAKKSKKEANILGDSDKEQLDRKLYLCYFDLSILLYSVTNIIDNKNGIISL